MLRSLKDLRRYAIEAIDGELGHLRDIYFDDQSWTLRYFVVETGSWLSGRSVLIAPEKAQLPDARRVVLPVGLTRQEIQESPDISADPPVFEQRRIEAAKLRAWMPYWGDLHGMPFTWMAPLPPPDPAPKAPPGDAHLRSAKEVTGYHLHARDGVIGHVDDFIVDTEGWSIRYLVVDTRDWLPGRHVTIAPRWVQAVSWDERAVYLEATRRQVEESPVFDPAQPVNRAYEERLYDYYGRPPYWDKSR